MGIKLKVIGFNLTTVRIFKIVVYRCAEIVNFCKRTFQDSRPLPLSPECPRMLELIYKSINFDHRV